MRKVLLLSMLPMVLGMTGCGQESPSLSVINRLDDFVITRAYVYAQGSACRGANLFRDPLPPDSVMTVELHDSISTVLLLDEDGDSYVFTGLEAGQRDSLEVTLDDISTTRFHYGDGPYAMVIRNGLDGSSIYYVRVDDRSGMGPVDYLQWNTLWPDEVLTAWVAEGSYRVVAEDQDGSTYTYPQVSVDSTGASVVVEEADRDTSTVVVSYGEGGVPVEIVSRLGSWNVVDLRFRELEAARWSENVIAADTLGHMESVVIRLSPGTYQMRAIDEDSDTYLLDSVRVEGPRATRFLELEDLDIRQD